MATEIIVHRRDRGDVGHGRGYHSQWWEVERVQVVVVELRNGNGVLFAHSLNLGFLHFDLTFEPRAIDRESVRRCDITYKRER